MEEDGEGEAAGEKEKKNRELHIDRATERNELRMEREDLVGDIESNKLAGKQNSVLKDFKWQINIVSKWRGT